jgi:molybdopterin converting factor small subunit
MNITVRFEAQVRRAAGVESATLVVDDGATVADLLRTLAQAAAEPVRQMLVDDRNEFRSTILIFLNDEHVSRSSERRLAAGDSVTITSPISGG